MTFLKRHIEITLILVVGFILRFVISITHSYSNDELSAINRLHYDNFSDLIEKGVMTGDMHPAGVQVFMKGWSILFGMNEGPMRFPFVILGVLSVWLVYKIGLKWVNKSTGIIAALLLSFLYFPIMNSEFARPYSPGLFFSLLAAWFYLKILFDDHKKNTDAIFLALAFAGAMYTHHFAFMFIGWMGVAGLLFANKKNLKYVLIAGVLGILLYLPHYSITDYQLGVGGLQWLAPPEANWLLQFIYHAFNESFLLVLLVLQFLIMSLIFRKKDRSKWSNPLTFMVILFFGIYLVGYFYSHIGTPVLKFPVMLFPLPFLLLLIGFVLSQFKMQKTLLLVLGVGCFSSTIIEKDLFGNRHYELFEEVAVDIVDWNKTYGEENIYTVYNLNNPNYMNFYADRWDAPINFDWNVLEFGDAAKLREDLKNRSEEYLIIGYSARLTLPQVFETCLEFYPEIVDGTKYNNSAVYLLKKSSDAKDKEYNLLAEFPSSRFVSNQEQYIPIAPNESTGFKGYNLGGELIYGPEYHFDLSEIKDYRQKYIKVEIEALIEPEGQLTASFSAKRDGLPVQNFSGEDYWEGRDLEHMLLDKGEAYFVFSIPDFIEYGDDCMISFWNRNGESEIVIKSIRVLEVPNIWN